MANGNGGVFAFTVTRASSPERAKLLQNTITEARKTAAHSFHWHIAASGVGEGGKKVIEAAQDINQVQSVMWYDRNVGQHIAWNDAIKLATATPGSFRYFLRLDDDCEFPSKRWLKKMVEFSQQVEDRFIISPTVKGLTYPPRSSQIVDIAGIPCQVLVDAIGGICRLHPLDLLVNEKHPFVADVRKPMGSGDATGIASWAKSCDPPVVMVYMKTCRVKHAKSTKGQIAEDSEHFSNHSVFQHIPYIPV